MASVRQRLQHEHLRPRQQRRVDLERRVLGGRADEDDVAGLDARQKRVLLRLVEAVNLVDEHDGAAARRAAPRFGGGHDLADLLDAGEHRAERDEVRPASSSATMRASVVLPVPGGPHRMSDCSTVALDGLAQRRARRRESRPGRRPRRACAGRMRSASGVPAMSPVATGVAGSRAPRVSSSKSDPLMMIAVDAPRK